MQLVVTCCYLTSTRIQNTSRITTRFQEFYILIRFINFKIVGTNILVYFVSNVFNNIILLWDVSEYALIDRMLKSVCELIPILARELASF